MRHKICTLFILCILYVLVGCQESGLDRPDFPLKEADIVAALEQTNLSGAISTDKTEILSKEHILYVLESDEQKFPVALISTSSIQNNRTLSLVFIAPSVSKGPAFEWETWKQQLMFATLLYGGFDDEEEVYQKFSGQEASGGKVELNEEWPAETLAERYEWDAEFPAGYCRIAYELVNSTIENTIEKEDLHIVEQSPRLTVSIYESKDYYQQQIEHTPLPLQILNSREEQSQGVPKNP